MFSGGGRDSSCDVGAVVERLTCVLWSVLGWQSGPWRRPRGTLRSSPATRLLTAACTPTPRGAPCQRLMGAQTPAPTRSPKTRPPGRSYGWSLARPPLPPRDSLPPLLPPTWRLSLSSLPTPVPEDQVVMSERFCIPRASTFLLTWLGSCHSAKTLNTPQVRQLCSFEGLYAFITS